jgi:hypothetical protein
MRSALKLLAFLLLAPVSAAGGEAFLAELEDLPLAPGLTELPGGLLFDSANGRIVEAQASGDAGAEQVRQFYETTLAQLGWQSAGPLQFRRDNEMLKITIDAKAKPLVVHFALSPTH